MAVTWNPGNLAIGQQLANFSSNFITAPGPFGGSHMLAVAMLPGGGLNLGNVKAAYFSDNPFQRSDQSEGPSLELKMELRQRWRRPVSYLARDHFGAPGFEVAQCDLRSWKPDEYAIAAMRSVGLSFLDDLILPPIGMGEVAGDGKVRDAASLMVRGIYSFWSSSPDFMPHRVVIGVKDGGNFDLFADALGKEVGGVLKNKVSPQGILRTISELMGSSGDGYRLVEFAEEAPFLFSREQVQRISDSLYDENSGLNRFAFAILRRLASSNFGPVKFQAGQALAEYGLTYRRD